MKSQYRLALAAMFIIIAAACSTDHYASIEMFYEDDDDNVHRAKLARVIVLSESELIAHWDQFLADRVARYVSKKFHQEPCEKLFNRIEKVYNYEFSEGKCSHTIKVQKDTSITRNVLENLFTSVSCEEQASLLKISESYADFVNIYPNKMCSTNYQAFTELRTSLDRVIELQNDLTEEQKKEALHEYVNNFHKNYFSAFYNWYEDRNQAIDLDTGGLAKIKAIKEKSYLLSEYKSGTYIKVLYPEIKVYRVTPEDELWMYAKPQIQRLLTKDMSSVIQLQNRALSKL